MTTVPWEGAGDGPTNMGRDWELAVAAEEGEAGGRVYEWDGAWVSLGRFQREDRSLLPEAPVRWVQRPTGGKAVLHGHDVTIGLAIPFSHLGLPADRCRSTALVYRGVVGVIVRALAASGLEACLGEDTPFCGSAVRTADCFGHVSPNDIVHPKTGQKVCGCALRLGERSVLVQASVPARAPLVSPESVFASPGPVAWWPLDGRELATRLESALNAASQGS